MTTTKAKTGKTEETPTEAPKKRGMFARFAELDHGGGDLVNFTIALGANRVRIIGGDPVLVRKHWDLPSSSDIKGAVPCRKFIGPDRMEAYITAVDEGTGDAWLEANCPPCEYCQWEAEHKGFYTLKEHYVFLLVHEGVVKMADIYQSSILRAIHEFENDEDWIAMMANGLTSDIEVNIKKESTGPKAQNVKYSVTGIPASKPLADEQMAEYLKGAPDVLAIKTPPSMDDEGNARWADYLSKAGEPKVGDKPKTFSS